MLSGSGGESIFVTIPIAMLVFCVLWLPFWIVGAVRWAIKHDNQAPVSKLLRASVIWPLVPLLFSVIGGTLFVMHGNGPTRAADARASEIVETHGLVVKDYRTWSNRHEGCGTATAGLTAASGSLTTDEVTRTLGGLGWSRVGVRPSGQSDEGGGTVVGSHGITDVTVDFSSDGSSASLRTSACRVYQTTRPWAVGLDLAFWATVAAWVFGLVGARWFWRWQKTRSALVRTLCVLVILAALAVVAKVASDTWMG